MPATAYETGYGNAVALLLLSRAIDSRGSYMGFCALPILKNRCNSRGEVFLEFVLVFPFLLLFAQGVTTLVLMVRTNQEASIVSRELGNLAYRSCDTGVDPAADHLCLGDAKTQIYEFAKSQLSLNENVEWEIPMFHSVPSEVPSFLTQGLHLLLLQCENFSCINTGDGGACTEDNANCTCTCGETALLPDLPATSMLIIDGYQKDRVFSKKERVSLWREFRKLLLRNGRILVSTASSAYETRVPLALARGVGHEQTIY